MQEEGGRVGENMRKEERGGGKGVPMTSSLHSSARLSSPRALRVGESLSMQACGNETREAESALMWHTPRGM